MNQISNEAREITDTLFKYLGITSLHHKYDRCEQIIQSALDEQAKRYEEVVSSKPSATSTNNERRSDKNAMKATIDIKTPSGKSLEGFPKEQNLRGDRCFNDVMRTLYATMSWMVTNPTNPNLSDGDIITIKISE